MKNDTHGGVLGHIDGPLKELFRRLRGKNAPEFLAAFNRFLRKENPWIFPVWKIIKSGGWAEEPDKFKSLLRKHCKVKDQAVYWLEKLALKKFVTHEHLIIISVKDMGFKAGAFYHLVHNKAVDLGFGFLSEEDAFQLRYQYSDQPSVGPEKHIEIWPEGRTEHAIFDMLKSFKLTNTNGLAIIGSIITPTDFLSADTLMVFCKRKYLPSK